MYMYIHVYSYTHIFTNKTLVGKSQSQVECCVLQCPLQCVACPKSLSHVEHCVLQCVAGCCSVLQFQGITRHLPPSHVECTVCCSVLQRVAACCSVWHSILQRVADSKASASIPCRMPAKHRILSKTTHHAERIMRKYFAFL